MVIKPLCPECGKRAVLDDEQPLYGSFKVSYFNCGHTQITSTLKHDGTHDWHSIDGKKELYDFQKDGVRFIEASGYCCLVADAMGSGKTMQALMAIKNNYKALTPCIVLGQSSVLYQWMKQEKIWVDDSFSSVFPVIGTTGFLPPGFDFYVVSRDTFGRKGFWKKFLTMGIKSIIVDEVQAFKDPTSNRSEALSEFIKASGIKHRIFLSGTPVMNRATEYFTVLNLIAPMHFPNYARFVREWIEPEYKESGQVVYKRLKKWKINQFQSLMKNYIIRREKHEILKDLPAFQRNSQSVMIDDPDIKNAYNKEISLFENFCSGSAKISSIELLGWLAKFRHITGKAKEAFTRQWIEEFLDSTEKEKILVGIHHEAVVSKMSFLLEQAGYKVITLTGKDDAFVKAQKIKQFQTDPACRVMIANILAGGIGVDGLQDVCNYGVVMERQWNSAIEEQFEARLHRDGQTKPVSFDYLNAAGTIDEFLDQMVEEKRLIVSETVQGADISGDDDAMMTLARKVIANPLR